MKSFNTPSLELHIKSNTVNYTYLARYLNLSYAIVSLVEALYSKSEGRGFDSIWGNWIFFFQFT
jgi:hypothetical protein